MEDNNQKPGMKPVNDNPNSPRKGPKFNIYWIYGLILLAIVGSQVIFGNNFGATTVEHSFQEFTEFLNKGQVAKLVVINNEHVDVYLKPGALPTQGNKSPSIINPNDKGPAFNFKIGTVDRFGENYERKASFYDPYL